ncbi:zonular occludens toxin domain-containing protein [Vibrio aestuarianus]|uniref:zonular occludens toxin domain-containing protein n=1 Tax=Vibrio aestuarianus TaxID=28171 RepID=UPI00237CD04A|nr:zonular occludens toxin domain-containing protein [Vibrio aestuarianus]MDE1328594.1 toxin [Vibrio aestuarianus]
MAITIRTGANGSYKSAYAAYFVIFEALKAGRVVVTNIEGMQPLDVIEQRFNIKFPSTTRLVRIFSRDAKGIELWQHFFCWCPLGALIVIDECQDIFSKNIGFRIDKVFYRPLSEFLPSLPKDYESFFNSRYTPADMTNLDPSETDDRGQAEYDEQGRIIYPFSFNEGFQRHRKYNWDIELLSPDWGQIDSAIRAPSEQCFFHKGRDQFFWAKRKPYIYKHAKNSSTPVIPKGKDSNLIKKKIPLDAFLLYKSTATGVARSSGALNVLTRNPMLVAVFFIIIFGIGYVIYGLSGLVFGSSSAVQDAQANSNQSSVSQSSIVSNKTDSSSYSAVSDGGNSNPSISSTVSSSGSGRLDGLRSMLGLYDIQNLYYMGHTTKNVSNGFQFFITLEAKTPEGTYYFDDTFLAANDIKYVHYDDCLLKLTKDNINLNVFCKPRPLDAPVPERAEVQLNSLF